MEKPTAESTARLAVGLMSGTSVDGVDAALVEIRGKERPEVRLLAFENTPYPPQVRARIFALFQPGQATSDAVGAMNFLLGTLFADAALAVIRKAGRAPGDIAFIGSHGQTIFHCPNGVQTDGQAIPCTVQIGEGAVIAARTGIPCVSDFRVADMAVGGQGAPLVPFTEYLLYRSESESLLLQNLGGIGNITVLPAGCRAQDVFAFDTGPGNMVIDALAERLFDGVSMDEGGRIAAAGKVDDALLAHLRKEPYFALPPPKTTGRELFGKAYADRLCAYLAAHGIAREDGVATATRLTAWSIAEAYRRFILPHCKAQRILIGGGGSYNRTLVSFIRQELAPFGIETCTQEQAGQNSDAKEAVAFALLADCTMAGRPNNLPRVTGASRPVVMGKISL